MRFNFTDSAVVLFISTFLITHFAFAAEPAVPVLSGLETAVEFWKRIFTRTSTGEVVFFDPFDHGKIYNILRVPESDGARAIIERERARIVAEYELNEEDGRVRSQRGAKERFIAGLKISGRYISRMQKIFRDEGLPPELAYLPLVESSFNVHARSSAGAVGMWQFMPDTGKKFLRITDSLDERRDPMVATRAAARLLKENRALLGNWPLAITAYNHGTEGLFRAIDTVGSSNLVEIIRRHQSPTFGFASKNFYAEFLAAAEIARNSDAYFPFLRLHRPVTLHEIEITRSVPVQSLLKPAAIAQKDFFEWNPALSPTAKVLPAGYRAKLPAEKVDRFATAQRRILESPARQKTTAIKTQDSSRTAARHRPRMKTAAKNHQPQRANRQTGRLDSKRIAAAQTPSLSSKN
jgi:peptidoglycan lytic transglycosylase D